MNPEEIAAQLWCLPQHGHKVMDAEFAKSIAEALTSFGNQRYKEGVLKAAKVAESFNKPIEPGCDCVTIESGGKPMKVEYCSCFYEDRNYMADKISEAIRKLIK